ncbi:ion transporter [Halomonas chromatireducens]|uniref:Ion transport protein n=1 Tax=Halomonas chromatireducens TaxID=507626 RepID=A0A0X8HC71_9GAMM|nr:ion transporter [Halomonas chromatireducens]AMC99904.1 Ion transport protein [Halomonas chromatireducens]
MHRSEPLAAKAPVTLYHDGHCPLCQREVAWLSRHPLAQRVTMVDIQASDFDPVPLGKQFPDMMGKLHVRDAKGCWFIGMDASRALYAVLGYRRLLRIFRVLRLVSMIPELRMLMAALFKSIPRMGYVALLMFIIFYIYGAIGSFLFHDVDERLWGNISLAMLTLFQVATFESWATAVLYPTMEHYPNARMFFLTFIFLNAFIFLNMMIGIVLDVMQKESVAIELESGTGEAAELHGLRNDVRQLRDQLSRMEAMLERRDG